MDRYVAIVFSILLGVAAASSRRFPDGFKFGAATAAYQIEGGWNASDKGESIWDRHVHAHPGVVEDRSNGDVACDSYHHWREDVRMVKEMGLDFYRFSISWPRVLPTGFANHISEDGSKYYSNLIDELLANGIEPVVTLYHWDLPQSLQDLGGWANPLIADWFADYARVIFDLYGDRVKTWITINEPIIVCDLGYNGIFAPGINSDNFGAYMCSRNILLAHARAYRLYEKEYKPKYHGEVSISNHIFWFEPATDQDMELTELSKDISIGRYSHPIFSAKGGWPPALERYIAEKSKKEGYSRSRLPSFTQEEIELIRGSYDFYGLNHYTTRTIRPLAAGEAAGVFLVQGISELGVTCGGRPEWPSTASEWFLVNPRGLRDTMLYLKQQYGDLRILITENGYSDSGAELDDEPRARYYKDYLEQVLLAMEEDDVKVIGYTAWTLMDNFEWTDGYQSRFGLHAVDFSDPLRPRTPRRSAHYYAAVARTHDLDATYKFPEEKQEL
ncbi:hypothetical protein MSG28_013929 [Choristoneura fumiferana]|uniref:Uncharacterized protein n=1 Tax=Choristoneura fumiferana TaxID=7141 RepID=A0ACC0K9H5_CHOFU|nr:hypothetical protein MSG28_013929 [Choristoneura fumiferana]